MQERDWVLSEFKSGAQPLLVATDVAQRGLDRLGRDEDALRRLGAVRTWGQERWWEMAGDIAPDSTQAARR